MSIRNKLYKGGVWNATSQVGSQGINFVLMVILARLLEPSEFGLLGMVMVFVGFLGYFSEFGLRASIIRKKNLDELDCCTAFWSGIIFSIFLYAVVFWMAPLIARFYNQPELTLITRIVFIDFLIKPFGFIYAALEEKSLNYDKLAKAQLVSLLGAGAMAVLLAFLGYGVWCLVFQCLVSSFLRVVALAIMVDWRPRWRFSFRRLKELLDFGIHVTLNNIIKFFCENIDYLLVGKLLGPTALGIYTLAFRLSRYPLEKFWRVFGKMLFPAFSSFQDDLERLQKNIMRISAAGCLILTPFLVVLLFGIKPIVTLLIGEKWLDTVGIIRIFIAYIFFMSLSFGDEPLIFVLNKVKTLNLIKTLTAIFLFAIGYWAVRNYGLVGIATVFTGLSIISTLIVKARLLHDLRINTVDFFRNLKFIFSYVMVIFMVTATYSYFSYNKLSNLTYLLGEVFLVASTVILMAGKYRLVDLRKRQINIDGILCW